MTALLQLLKKSFSENESCMFDYTFAELWTPIINKEFLDSLLNMIYEYKMHNAETVRKYECGFSICKKGLTNFFLTCFFAQEFPSN